jgi:hypothetical protein
MSTLLSRAAPGTFALATLLFSSVAQAASYAEVQTAPKWTWTKGATTRWHYETDLYTPRGFGIAAVNNKSGQVGSMHIVVDADCTTAAPDGKSSVIDCTFAYVGLSGTPLAEHPTEKDAQDIKDIFTEWNAALSAGSVEIIQSPDGRIKGFDLRGMKRENARAGEIIELQRILLQRAMCLWDLPLSTKLDDYKRGWSSGVTSTVMQLPTTSGTAGAYTLQYTTAPVADGLLPISTSGRGMLEYGTAADASSGSRIVNTSLNSQAVFDLAQGLMVWRGLSLDGRLTAGSSLAGTDVEFYQASAVQKVDTFLPNGGSPLSLMASRAPKRDIPPAELSSGIALVPFATLGMEPLFIPAMPLAGKQLGLPTTVVSARLEVAEDGSVTAVRAYKGYEALIDACEAALKGARFARMGKAYAVDVDVEFRKEEESK